MMSGVKRYEQKMLEDRIGQQKVLVLYGTRRVGKTFLLEQIANKLGMKCLFLLAEDLSVQEKLGKRVVSNYIGLFAGKSVIIIDEAQHIPEAGKALKLMIDGVKGITIIASGSSSFDLVNKVGEPLTGRSYTHLLLPLAQCELKSKENLFETTANLESRLVYGSYPELMHLLSNTEKEEYLKDLVQSYLLKDIFMYSGIRNSGKVLQLLKLIAFQCGNEVSYSELALNLGISKVTVENYLDLLSKVFVIHSLGGYSGNLRKEVVKSHKWFFYDNGIRNAIINNFNPLISRNDQGQLFENYFISERVKFNQSKKYNPEYYFWRTYDGQEIDLIEVSNGKLSAYECKWGAKKKNIPGAFYKAYPEAPFILIHKENYIDYIT
jgi:predicted AAA+ superfamily ATPase